MAFDIRREIASTLSFGPLNFRMDPNIKEENYKPLELLLEFFDDNNIHTREDLAKIASIHTHITSYNNPQGIYITTTSKDVKEEPAKVTVTSHEEGKTIYGGLFEKHGLK